MKLSTKIILPIILISALLILLAGCFGVPADEEPGVTEVGAGTITGIIAAPCCNTSGEPVSENSGSPDYWCYWCEKDWYLQEGIEVILTSGQVEIATTTTDEFGEYIFTDVPPGENYVITAYCPDKEIPLVMDVVPEIIEGGEPFDAGTSDLVSTSLGLVVDYVTYFAAWDPEDISLDKVIAAKPNFDGFPKFKKLIREVRRVLENCEDVDEDDNLLDALCKAAEEVGKSDFDCAPGYAPVLEAEEGPGPGPTPPVTYTLTAIANPTEGGTVTGGGTYNSGTVVLVTATPASGWYFDEWTGDASGTNPTTTVTMNANKTVTAHFTEEDPCIDNTPPEITAVTLYDGQSTINIYPEDEITLIAGMSYEFCVYAEDDGIPSLELTYSLTIDGDTFDIGTSDSGSFCFSAEPLFGDVGTYEITVNVSDGCENGIDTWGPFTVVVECPPLLANAGPDQTVPVCPEIDALVDLTGSGTEGIGTYTYSWDFGDGGTTEDSTEQSPEDVPFGAAGSPYTVTLTVTDTCGTSDSDQMIVTITEPDPLLANAGPDQTVPVCPEIDALVDLTGSGTEGIGTYTYSWDFGDGGTTEDSTEQSPEDVPFGAAGSPYTVTLTVTDTCGTSDSDQMIVTITEPDPLLANAGPDQTVPVCPEIDALVDLTGSGTEGIGTYTYSWDFGDGGTTEDSTEQSPEDVPFGAAGSPYTVTLTVTDTCGTSDSDQMIVTITEPDPLLANAGPDQTVPVCPEIDALVDLTGSGTEGIGTYTYSWDFGDGGTTEDSTEQSPEDVPFGAAGSPYTVTLTVTDTCGTSDSDQMIVTITESACCSADLSSLLVEIKEGSSGWSEKIIISSGPITQKTYYIYGTQNANKFRFKAAALDTGCTVKYNFYRGVQCANGGYWLYDDDLGEVPPGWYEEVISDGYYPADANKRNLCNKGGNILIIQVGDSPEGKYTIYIDRQQPD